jgi:Ca-activated chloride channel family protein
MISARQGAPPREIDARSRATYRVAVETVALTVTVTSKDGSYVGQLAPDDFVVHDNGVPQMISIFEHGDVPLDLALLIDASASVYDRFDLIRAAAKGFVRSLGPYDRGAVVGFNDRFRLLADWTSDLATLDAALDSAAAGGGTALYTSLYIAMGGLGPTPVADGMPRRRIIVVLSDGENTRGPVSYEHVLESTRRSAVTIYTIRITEPVPPAFARLLGLSVPPSSSVYLLGHLARETGGRDYSLKCLDELPNVYASIAAELANQYMLGYVPAGHAGDKAFHRVTVSLPRHPTARARTRVGYLVGSPLRQIEPSQD